MEMSSNHSGDSSSFSSSPSSTPLNPPNLSPVVEGEPSSSRFPCYIAPPSWFELRRAEGNALKLGKEVNQLGNELGGTTIKSLKFEFKCQTLKEEKENWEEEKQAIEEERAVRWSGESLSLSGNLPWRRNESVDNRFSILLFYFLFPLCNFGNHSEITKLEYFV